jgi:hypothetical protein
MIKSESISWGAGGMEERIGAAGSGLSVVGVGGVRGKLVV